ncbi:Insulin-like [Cinara cedri]|uniref:Insulin-like n=1 Tax=Cinara cedri TaxID=506608 RepID=A0A5E4MTI7_9HEMI|nr:Insulin-like [Cinara cedri]
MLMVVVSTAFAEQSYEGQIIVSWTEPQKFCGKVLPDLVWSICPHHNEDDKIPEQFRNKPKGKGIATDCCINGCTPLHVLENYCINSLRADTTKNTLTIYRSYSRPSELPIVKNIQPNFNTTTQLSNSNTTTNIESSYSGPSINEQPNFKTTTQPSPLTMKTIQTSTTTIPTTITTTTNKMYNVPTIESLYWAISILPKNIDYHIAEINVSIIEYLYTSFERFEVICS